MTTTYRHSDSVPGPEIILLADEDNDFFVYASGHVELDRFAAGACAHIAIAGLLRLRAPRAVQCIHGYAKWVLGPTDEGEKPCLVIQSGPGPGRIPITYVDWASCEDMAPTTLRDPEGG